MPFSEVSPFRLSLLGLIKNKAPIDQMPDKAGLQQKSACLRFNSEWGKWWMTTLSAVSYRSNALAIPFSFSGAPGKVGTSLPDTAYYISVHR
jgi:hypothetical protein